MSLELASARSSASRSQHLSSPPQLGSHTVDRARPQPSRFGRLRELVTKSVRALGSYVVESVKIARMSRADRAAYRAVRQAGGQAGALSHTPDHPVDSVAAEARVRTTRLQHKAHSQCRAAIGDAIDALTQPKPDATAILRATDMVRLRSEAVVKAHEDAGGEPLDKDQARTLQRELLDSALQELDNDALSRLFHACNRPSVHLLAGALEQTGLAMAEHSRTAELGLVARSTGSVLPHLEQRVRAALESRHEKLALPQTPSAGATAGDVPDAPAVHEAVASLFDPTWNKPYPQPYSVPQILGTPGLLADLRTFAKTEFNEENILFAQAATSFLDDVRPSLKAADALIKKFLAADSQQPVNISGPEREAIRKARAEMDPYATQAGEDLVKAIRAASETINAVITSDMVPRFGRAPGNVVSPT